MLGVLNIARRANRRPGVSESPARIEIVDVRRRFDGPDVLNDVTLTVASGESMVLLGPSGCGKTTLLRSIAGLERIDSGSIAIDDEIVSGPGRHVRPEHRHIGMVFQDWALFPHLTVADNVAFGLNKAERDTARVAETLELVGLAGLGDRRPATLSGGQQQRVALARALAPQPRALLLDEPFSNLDTGLRVRVRNEVNALLRSLGITAVYVTHDQEEAFALGDRIAVMMAGSVVQVGTPFEIYERPVAAAISDFVGETNHITGVMVDGGADTCLGKVAVSASDRIGQRVQVLIRPEHLAVTADPEGAASIESIEYYGHDHVLRVRLADGSLVAVRGAMAPSVTPGDRVVVRHTGPRSVAFDVDD